MPTTNSKWKTMTAIAVVGVVVAAIVTSVQAHKGATGVVMQRMMAMKAMGDSTKALADMVTGKSEFEPAKVKEIAATIKGHAAHMPHMFPEGSINGPSEATPAIWKNWSEFVAIAKELESLAAELGDDASEQKSSALPVFAKIGKTCSACHQDYRRKQK